jgi:hypothetical protein
MTKVEVSGTDIETEVLTSRTEGMDAERLTRFAQFWMRNYVGGDADNIVWPPDEDDLVIVFHDGWDGEIMFRVLENS